MDKKEKIKIYTPHGVKWLDCLMALLFV